MARVRLPWERVWTPDIVLYNAAGDGEQGREMRTLIQVDAVLRHVSRDTWRVCAGGLPGQRDAADAVHLHEQVHHGRHLLPLRRSDV